MLDAEKEKCDSIIIKASIGAGAVGLSPIPFSDMPPLIGIQMGMIGFLANVFDVPITAGMASAISKTLMVSAAGKVAVRQLLKFLPVAGNAANGGIAYILTYNLGWHMAKFFDENKEALRNTDGLDLILESLRNFKMLK